MRESGEDGHFWCKTGIGRIVVLVLYVIISCSHFHNVNFKPPPFIFQFYFSFPPTHILFFFGSLPHDVYDEQ